VTMAVSFVSDDILSSILLFIYQEIFGGDRQYMT